MPDAPGLELIAQGIEKGRQGTVIETSVEHDRATLIVNPERHPARPAAGCATRPSRATASSPACTRRTTCPPPRASRSTTSCSAASAWSGCNVKALLADPAAGDGLQTAAGEEKLPELDSCVALYPTADFQEREAYDFFGIVFRGHPDLRRIAMPEDYVGWPQRRDFPIGGEPVLYTHNEIEAPRWFE